MIVHIMRHAPIEFGKDLPKVADRHITPEGRKWARNVVRIAKNELGLNPDWIISSPLLRAKETAEIAAEEFNKPSKLVYDDCLLGEREVNETYERLRKLDKTDSVLLVSHQPLLRNLIADLLGAKSKVGLYSGAIACVQCDTYPKQGKGILLWLLPPSNNFNGKKWIT
ncbi:MAG TPA: histidine phosphatase family protein [Candidatus Bathyarchaeia archaeon]|nr:histidine phosphatase family protein [Candidatus Bathyarchaeia archaeon]